MTVNGEDDRSHSWYIAVKNIMRKYDLPEPLGSSAVPPIKVCMET